MGNDTREILCTVMICLSGLLNRLLVGTWKSVPTLFVRTSKISGLSEPRLTNRHSLTVHETE